MKSLAFKDNHEALGADVFVGQTSQSPGNHAIGYRGFALGSTGDHRFTTSPLVTVPELPYPSDGMKMLQKSMPLPAGPLSHACTV